MKLSHHTFAAPWSQLCTSSVAALRPLGFAEHTPASCEARQGRVLQTCQPSSAGSSSSPKCSVWGIASRRGWLSNPRAAPPHGLPGVTPAPRGCSPRTEGSPQPPRGGTGPFDAGSKQLTTRSSLQHTDSSRQQKPSQGSPRTCPQVPGITEDLQRQKRGHGALLRAQCSAASAGHSISVSPEAHLGRKR